MVSFSVLPSLVSDSLRITFTLCLGLLGHGGNLAAEYLKENLLKNLMKHPEFLTDTKLAISNAFYFCLAVSFASVEILFNAANSFIFCYFCKPQAEHFLKLMEIS